MPPSKHGPMLTMTVDAVTNVQPDELGSLWTVFTKCKESLQDGARLENISWRLWHHELTAHSHHQPSSPILVADSTTALPPVIYSGESGSSSDEDDEASKDWENVDMRIEDQTTQLAEPSASNPPSAIPSPTSLRGSSRSQARPPSHHRLRNSHPEATSSARPPVEGHRANSAPSHYRTRTRSQLNIGKIISSLLPDTIDALSARSASTTSCSALAPVPDVTVPAIAEVQLPSTPPTLTAPTPTLVIVQPTPRPTPPDTPAQSVHRRFGDQLSPHLSLSRAVEPALPNQQVPDTAASGHPDSGSSDEAMDSTEDAMGDDKGRKKFFFKESPGGLEAGAGASGSSSSSTVKTEALPAPFVQEAINGVMAAVAAQVTAKGGRVPKKGKEQVRRPTANNRHIGGHAHPKHPVRAAATTHQRQPSTASTTTAPPKSALRPTAKSKSTTNIAALRNAAPPANNPAPPAKPQQPAPPPVARRSSSRSSAPAQASNAPAKASKAVADLKATQDRHPQPVHPAVRSAKTVTHARAHTETTVSSDYESDSEGEDSSWASDDEDEEKPERQREAVETGTITRRAAEKAAEQQRMFAKVPVRSYSNLAQVRRQQPGLLTSLFHPDPSVARYLPSLTLRNHNSEQHIGTRTPSGPAPASQTSKSAAALPLAAQVTVTQVAVNPPARPGLRLRGKPEGEMEESSDDEDEEDTIQLSKSVAQRRLEALVGRSRRAPTSVAATPQAHVQMTIEENPQTTLPVKLPHPYNLPAPAPVATPRTTRREMLSTEMSESLRRNILWERETNKRLFRGAVRPRFGTGMLGGLKPLTSTSSDVQGIGGTRSGDEVDRRPTVRMARNYSSDNFHAAGW